MKDIILVTIYILLLATSNAAFSQTKETVNWLRFEALDSALQKEPKKVFIAFYTDWCSPCLKMKREVFTDKAIIKALNRNYYAVKMNVETTDTIYFGKQTFVNERSKRINPIHQIPLLMARQKNKPFALPALIFLDENFIAQSRYFQYLNPKQFLKILSEL